MYTNILPSERTDHLDKKVLCNKRSVLNRFLVISVLNFVIVLTTYALFAFDLPPPPANKIYDVGSTHPIFL